MMDKPRQATEYFATGFEFSYDFQQTDILIFS